MLTRLKVSGFKNLVDVDIFFGPFTCIAGVNGVGKSNLFDAIAFLSALASRSLLDAALSVRDEGGRTADLRSLFHRVGDRYAKEMSFEVEMIVPEEGQDDLGQTAKASITFLRYALCLAYRSDDNSRALGALEIKKEELTYITQGDAPKHLLFPHTASNWRKSVIKGRRSSGAFISTADDISGRVIKLHQDGGSGGRPLARLATNLPRTVLSATNAAESPTALLARREMQSWNLLQLEPSSLRKPDEFTSPTKLGTDGSHLPATLYRLEEFRNQGNGSGVAEGSVYAQVANRLSELIDDVKSVLIDRDEKRELLSLVVVGRDGTSYPARALSDGTLRFLALAVLELDSEAEGLLCFEEPENGIHPERIPAMLQLLQDISTKTDEEVGPDNPLRQVIINTHSPTVVLQVPDESLIVAESKDSISDGKHFKRVCFSYLPDTWRAKNLDSPSIVAKGKLLSYLSPILPEEKNSAKKKTRRVVDRPDLKPMFPALELLMNNGIEL
jgi:predicted ATPase